jgi:hypothetical protein
VNWLQTGCLTIVSLATQPLPGAAVTDHIKRYVDHINADKRLTRSTLNSYPGHRDPAGRDSLLHKFENIYFPCTAVVSYSGSEIVKIKEILRYGSGFDTHEYYLRNDSLLFVEQKHIRCDYKRQSDKIRYTEKDYTQHLMYYYVADSCIAIGNGGTGPLLSHGRYQSRARPQGGPGYFAWQATQYVALFKKS